MPPPTFYVGSDNQCTYSKIQDAINAVSTTATCAPIIYVTNEHKPWNEALTITNRTFTLIGTASACSTGGATGLHAEAELATPTSPQATISGSGRNAPVITINGTSHVTLQGLEITGGSIDQNSEGGGIFFNGTGSLTLTGTTVDNNQAGYGGGIDVSPTGNATLTLQANTLVINNTAGLSGGGIRIEGSTRLYMLAENSTVSFNDAQFSYGGGIEVLGGARADIGSSGSFGVGAVSNNSAPYGAGIAIVGTATGDANVRVFSTSATLPVLISNNTSTGQGGAFYLLPYFDVSSKATGNATLCGYNSRITGNRALDGAAIFAAEDEGKDIFGNTVSLNPAVNCGPESPASLGAVECAVGTSCNEISDNQAVDSGGDASGSIVSASRYSVFAVERTKIIGNVGTDIVHTTNGQGGYLHGCLISGNHAANQVIYSYEFFASTIANCTLAGNTIDNGYTIFSHGALTLTDTIIDQPNVSAMDHEVGTCGADPCPFTVSYVMSNEISTLPVSANVIAIDPADPLFADAANGDYHLVAYYLDGSLVATRAIDFAPTEFGDAAHDLNFNAYGQNVPAVPDAYGSRDLGAYEMTPILDRIHGDAFGDALSLVVKAP
ncbi:MAG TPA: hypothetical protein VH082_14035 [Rudaea sp.]|nr:hypothetical protein [Rudaea sp.]